MKLKIIKTAQIKHINVIFILIKLLESKIIYYFSEYLNPLYLLKIHIILMKSWTGICRYKSYLLY